MFPRGFAGLILGIGLCSAGFADEPAASTKPAWGHVKGRVILKGELDDPRLQKYFADLPLHAPLTLKEAKKGDEPRMINLIPNETLIVDPTSRGVRNALVYLKTRPERVHPDFGNKPLAPVELTYANRQFAPRAFLLQAGQTLVMSVDKAAGEPTNFQADLPRNGNFNLFVTPEPPGRKWTPQRAEPGHPILIQSTIYPTAKAYFLVKDHPYVAITDHKGRFELKNLPAGKHELVIWHETVGYVARSLTLDVQADQTTEVMPQVITVEQLAR